VRASATTVRASDRAGKGLGLTRGWRFRSSSSSSSGSNSWCSSSGRKSR